MKKIDPAFRVWLFAALIGVALTSAASVTINHFSQQKPEVDAGESVAVTVRLVQSDGQPISGGQVQYHDHSWHSAGETDANGEVSLQLDSGEYSFQMTYAGGRVTQVQHVGQNSTVVFNTVPVTVRLLDSQNAGLAGGDVMYHMWAWQILGTTGSSGDVVKQLLPVEYSFQMTYAGGRLSKKQNVADDPLVVFNTVPVTVRLLDSQNNGLAGGDVKYHMWAWQDLGTTGSSGDVVKELLPVEYSFQMTYAGGRLSKKQNVADDPLVVFNTVPVTVRLLDSQNAGLAGGDVKYHMWAWQDLGTTGSSGDVVKELLPVEYSFQMTYAGGRLSKKQNVTDDPLVVFNTTLVTVQLNDQNGQPLSGAEVKYHYSGWRTIGMTDTSGAVTKELLPVEYTFMARYDGETDSKRQNVALDPRVLFGAEVQPTTEPGPVVEDLNLTSMCSDDPTVSRRWRVRNPNAFAVEVRWQVYGTSQTGTYLADPGDTFFETNTVSGANTTKINWYDETGTEKSKSKASGGAICKTNPVIELTKTADRENALVGESIKYTLVVANTGDVTLHNVTLSDPLLSLHETIGELAVGASVTRVRTYGPITEEDLPGPLENTSTANSDETDAVQSSVSVDLQRPTDPPPGVDTTPPTVTILTPGTDDLVSGSVDITGEAQDETCLDGLTVSINGAAVATTLRYVWDSTTVDDGWHEITLRAEDCSGNRAEVTVDIEVDNTAPMPPQMLAANTPGLGGPVNQVLLGGLAEDQAQLQLWVKSPGESEFALSTTLSADSCGRWETVFEFYAQGDYVFQVGAKDRAGNWAWGDEFAPSLDMGVQMTTMIIQQGSNGYTGTTDTWLSEWDTTTKNGNETDMHVRGGTDMSMVLRFDLSQVLPSAYTVQRASLGLYGTEQSNVNPLALGVFQMERSWSEDEANYTQADDVTPWNEPGAGGAEDRAVMPSGGAWVIADETWTVFDVATLAQGWASDPSDNHGLLIKGSGQTSVDYSFASSEYPEVCRRPVLYVIYSSAEPMMLMD